LKVQYDYLPSNFAFNFKLRRYTVEQRGKLEELRQEAIGNNEVPKGEGEDK
jgi:hypothetical protein